LERNVNAIGLGIKELTLVNKGFGNFTEEDFAMVKKIMVKIPSKIK